MRSWENRPDTIVCDEPLYAHYLSVTELDHPGREEVLAHYETDWEIVVNGLCGDVVAPVYYQKHMAHHLLPNIGRDWLSQMKNIFLIRNPREMITSLVKTIPIPTIDETGLPQQLELFEHVQRATGSVPLVLDSKDVLQHPQVMLTKICNELGIPFYKEMLAWPAGSRESDGIWAPHWYASVEASTGFVQWKPKEEAVPDTLESMVVECVCIYEQLAAHRLQP